ncbi:MAG TPA: carboxylating nicotinate-nucleotide diphosphorylase [Usitatibacteraceae bacterium]
MSDFIHDIEATITADVTRALAEDIGAGDLTASLIPEDARGAASVITRQDAVLCGAEWFDRCYTEIDPDCEIFWHARDGAALTAGQPICEISGKARTLLTAERSSLNFLATLSGVATQTRRYVQAVAGTNARIFDTRKTIPGLRMALKYAVRTGGGHNHRIGLFDGILIKENHIMSAGGIRPALEAAYALVKHAAPRDTMIEVEVETLEQLREALDCKAKLILLDNFKLEDMRAARELAGRRAELEASGGINLQTVRLVAATGVDRISVGSLTKDIQAVDLSMRFRMH